MSMRGRAGLAVLGIVGLGVAVAMVASMRPAGKPSAPATATAAAVDPTTPLAGLAGPLGRGEAQALAALYQRVHVRPESGVLDGLDPAEAADWIAALGGLRAGYPHFSAYGRASAITATSRILEKFAVDPAPAEWSKVLAPAHDLLTAGLADAAPDVRLTTMAEVGRLWIWMPGRSLMAIEEALLADWKQSLHGPVVRRLGDPLPAQRAAAVACLGALPIDSAATPAVAYLADPSVEVRQQVIASFARRRGLLDDEALLRQYSARDPRIQPLLEQALKARGLTTEQIGLGALMVHSKPELRASVIPMLDREADVDPVVWLVRLSEDQVESVRIKAAEALARQDAPEARRRLDEMAIGDPSAEVKARVLKLLTQPLLEETAALPPLPGSSSLLPKAN